MQRKDIIALSGFMGSGKTTAGRALAALAGLDFVDLDEYIEQAAGKTIPEIFAESGEAAFRAAEVLALKEIFGSSGPLVLSLGGGTVCHEEARALVRDNAVNVYLRAGEDTIVSHLRGETGHRPMIGPASEESLAEKVRTLMVLRSSVYEEASDLTVDTDSKTVEEIAAEIAGRLR